MPLHYVNTKRVLGSLFGLNLRSSNTSRFAVHMKLWVLVLQTLILHAATTLRKRKASVVVSSKSSICFPALWLRGRFRKLPAQTRECDRENSHLSLLTTYLFRSCPQNLRAAGTSRTSKSSSGLRPPHDWQREAEEFSALATNVRNQSGALRDNSSSLQNAFETRAKNSQFNTQEALRSKLQKSESLNGLLSDTLQGTEDELAALTRCKEKLEKHLEKRNKALDVNYKRLQLRAQRPDREMVADDVQSRLLNQGRLLQSGVDKIVRCLEKTEYDIKRLFEAKDALEADKADKEHAMHLDQMALNLQHPDNVFSMADGEHLTKKVRARPWINLLKSHVT